MNNRQIYFNEKKHRYTDEFGNFYTSVTTLIGNYENKFSDKADDIALACERIGKNPFHAKYERYKNMTAMEIKRSWNKTSDVALDRGNKRHNFLEDSVKTSSGFVRLRPKLTGDRLYTVDNILKDTSIGLVNLRDFERTGVRERYPRIYKIISALVQDGWRLYAEIGVYNVDLLVSGLIDLFAVKGNQFIIVDWKTNKMPIQFIGGYYEKDNKGNVSNFKVTNETMKVPLNYLQQCDGSKFGLQLGTYSFMAEFFGLEFSGAIICQILHDTYTKEDDVPNKWIGLERVETYEIPYMKDDVEKMLNHYVYSRNNGQLSMGGVYT